MTSQINNPFNNPFFKGTIDANGNTLNLNPEMYGNLFTVNGPYALRYLLENNKSIGANILIPQGSRVGGYPFSNTKNYLPATYELAMLLNQKRTRPELDQDKGFLKELNSAYGASINTLSNFETPTNNPSTQNRNILLKLTDIILGEKKADEPKTVLKSMFLTPNNELKPGLNYHKFRLVPLLTKEI